MFIGDGNNVAAISLWQLYHEEMSVKLVPLFQTAVKNILLLCQLLPSVASINTLFFPCSTDDNVTAVDCSDRPLRRVPLIQSSTVVSLDLSQTKILRVEEQALSGLPNLQTLRLMGNCLPSSQRASEHRSCSLKIHHWAFKSLLKLQVLYLSSNSLTVIPWLPESLRVLDLQNNHIFNIVHPLKTPHLEELYLSKNCYYTNPCHHTFSISLKVFNELSELRNLTLGYNNLTAVPTGLPPSLRSLDLRENRITEVLEGSFSGLPLLHSLNLEWNCQRCDHAARPCFPCPGKEPLKLHPKSFYAENSSITYLGLRGNSLKKFPKGVFKPLRNLRRLDLSDNLLAYQIRNSSFFAELKSLTWISLIYNYEPLRTFQEMVLSPYIGDISGLEYLLLSGNFFHKVSKQSLEVLSKLHRLKKLELRMNFINTCDFKALKQIPSLISVVLSQNMLSFSPCCSSPAPEAVTQGTCQEQSLYSRDAPEPPPVLRDPELTSGLSIWGVPQVDRLEMIKDHVSASQSLWDRFCRNNLTFDLSQNNIMSLKKEMFEGMENAVCLDLSFNYMSQTLRNGTFDRLTNLVFLNMSYNRLDFYYLEAFSELKHTLRVLDVSNNEFHFQMRGMGHRLGFIQYLSKLEFLSLANNGMGMRIDPRLISSSLKHLYFSGNHLDVMWEPGNSVQYTYFFQNLTSLVYLDISNNQLRSISQAVLCSLPGSIRNLIISDNLLAFFPWQNISALSNLSHLDLSRNYLYYLPHKVIHFGEFFSHLDLSYNRVYFIPEQFFSDAASLKNLDLSHNQIKELNHRFLPAPFKNGSSLQVLALHANPFKCDCDTSWFSDFLRTTTVKIPHLSTRVHCEYPESQRGVSILSIDQHSCQDLYGSLASFVCSFLVVAFTVLPLLKHLYGWDLWYILQLLWAGHKGYSQLPGADSPCQYDAFVVFDTSNPAVRDWVYNDLTVNLEDSGPRRFSLCLEERDWTPGLSCIENLHSAVYNSVKTVFVLSSAAAGNETVTGVIRQAFFMVQQRLLDEKVSKEKVFLCMLWLFISVKPEVVSLLFLHQVDVAVLILLDETFPKLKYLQLRKRLCRKSVLSWPRNPRAQPLFWNQVRTALASDNLSFYDSNMSESFSG